MSNQNSLQSFQAIFTKALTDSSYQPTDDVFVDLGISPRQRLNVYFNNDQIAQESMLSSLFPAVRRIVGNEFFFNMAAIFGRKYHPTSGDLREFGARLPEFIKDFEPLHCLPYLPDVARLEWACHESLHSAGTSPANVLSNNSIICLAPNARLLQSRFPVAAIWDFALRDHDALSQVLNIHGAGPDYIVTMRPDTEVEVLTVSEDDWKWLESIDHDHANQAAFQLNPDRFLPFIRRGILTYSKVLSESH